MYINFEKSDCQTRVKVNFTSIKIFISCKYMVIFFPLFFFCVIQAIKRKMKIE